MADGAPPHAAGEIALARLARPREVDGEEEEKADASHAPSHPPAAPHLSFHLPSASSSSSSLLLSPSSADGGPLSPTAEPTSDPIHAAGPDLPPSIFALCCPPSFAVLSRQPRMSSAVAEARELRLLFRSSLHSTASSLSSFALSSLHTLRDFALSAPLRLRGSALGFYRRPSSLRVELLMGLSLSALLVVDAIAFSITAGVPPIVGMYSCFMLTLITSALGGCPGMVSGAAGSTAAVQAAITSSSGVFSHLDADARLQLLFLTLLLAGVLEVLIGVLGLARLAAIIPAPVMVGFLNGLAVIILISQMAAFQFCPSSPTFTDCSVDERHWLPASQLQTWLTAIQLLLALAVMEGAHRLPIPHIRRVPAVLIAVFLGSCLEHGVFRAARSTSPPAPSKRRRPSPAACRPSPSPSRPPASPPPTRGRWRCRPP